MEMSMDDLQEALFSEPPSNITSNDMTSSAISEMSKSYVLLSSAAGITLDEDKLIRKRWSWYKYVCFMFPLIWTGAIYTCQLIFGLTARQADFNGVYNVVSGVIGLTSSIIQIVDNWYYIKPASWITQRDVITPYSYPWDLFVFIVLSIIDMFLFMWSILGSVFALTLIDAGDYNAVLTVFSIFNILMQWSKYGAFMFLIRFMARRYVGRLSIVFSSS